MTIGDRIGVTIEIVPHIMDATTKFPTGECGIMAYWRTGVVVHNPNALRAREWTAIGPTEERVIMIDGLLPARDQRGAGAEVAASAFTPRLTGHATPVPLAQS